jgi:hypothetical protein
MALQDIDLKYKSGSIYTAKNVTIDGLVAMASGATVGGNPITSGGWSPADHGLTAWSGDPAMATSTATITNGTVYLARLNIRAATTISKIWWDHTTAPTTPTAGQNFAGIYSSAGTLLASASIDANTTSGLQNVSITPQVVGAGFIWAAFVFNAATPPVLMRFGGQTAAANVVNLSAATYRWAVNGTGATALASTITPASNSQTGVSAIWAAAS